MGKRWIRRALTAELLSDAHFGSGAGGAGVDALVSRDRHGRPVIWASHVEGVLRDAARRLGGDQQAEALFGRPGGDYKRRDRQRAIFTSLYTTIDPGSRIWRSAARQSFDNRAPRDETLRVIEYVPRGTRFEGQVELPEDELDTLERLLAEVDALGSGRSAGAGRVRLELSECNYTEREIGQPAERLRILLKNRDPLRIAATATPDNLIPSQPFVPGRTLLGALAAWLISEAHTAEAKLLTSGEISVSDALPLPERPSSLATVEVLPAPLSLHSDKPEGFIGDVPWWARPPVVPRRCDAWRADGGLKRPEEDLFLYRSADEDEWTAFRPARRVRLRNGRPDPRQPAPSLFAVEEIVEETYFLAELHGSREVMQKLSTALRAVLVGSRWLRVGRGGAPVEVVDHAWFGVSSEENTTHGDTTHGDTDTPMLLILTSDLLVYDEYLRWRTALDETALRDLLGASVQLTRALQDSVMVRGFNGTTRLWRMPACAVRRGSVFEVRGPAVAILKARASRGEWLGERTHEGFGRFRVDAVLPGITEEAKITRRAGGVADEQEEAVASREEEVARSTKQWFEEHNALAKAGEDRKPSLSQWFDLVAELHRSQADGGEGALERRLNPATAGTRAWMHRDAKAILEKLKELDPAVRAAHAQFFVRWLRAAMRANRMEAFA